MRDPLWWTVLNILWAPVILIGLLLYAVGEALRWCAFRIDDATWGWRARARLWHNSQRIPEGIAKQ